MLDAPRQDWKLYEAFVAKHDRQLACSLSMVERFARYEDLYQLVCGRNRSNDQQARLDASRWKQKLAIRRKQNRIFDSSK